MIKEKVSIVLILLLFGISQIFAAPCGDVDSNGTINIIDALMTAQYYVGLDPAGFDPGAADVSGDGTINIVDALQLAQFYVGLITALNGCTCCIQTPPGPITYELQAETDVAWDDAAIESDHSGYTGGGYVNTANSSGTWIEWSITVADDTPATCDFRYAASTARAMDLSINGSTLASLSFANSGGWTTWAVEEAPTVNLNAGTNTIRLTATTSGGAPNMDKIDITLNTIRVTPPPTKPPTLPPTPSPTPFGYTDPPITNALVGWATTDGGTTGGGNTLPVTVSSMSELKSQASGTSARVIYVSGQLRGTLRVGSNKTIIGKAGARITNGGSVLQITSATNVIIKNIHFEGDVDGGADMTNIRSSRNIWLDHCNLVNGGDGMIDIVGSSDLITISWCKLWYTAQTGHQNAMLLASSNGSSESRGHMNITMYGNWWVKNVTERAPRVRFGKVHIFNNLYTATLGWSYYAIRCGYEANVLSENNVYKDFTGNSAGYHNGATLVFNYFDGSKSSVLESNGDIFINCTEAAEDYNGVLGGTFDTGDAFTPPYVYTLQPADTIENLIRTFAGPQDSLAP